MTVTLHKGYSPNVAKRDLTYAREDAESLGKCVASLAETLRAAEALALNGHWDLVQQRLASAANTAALVRQLTDKLDSNYITYTAVHVAATLLPESVTA